MVEGRSSTNKISVNDMYDIREGASDLGIDLTEHIAHVIAGMQADAERLGLTAP